jgi:hypothetical protein
MERSSLAHVELRSSGIIVQKSGGALHLSDDGI